MSADPAVGQARAREQQAFRDQVRARVRRLGGVEAAAAFAAGDAGPARQAWDDLHELNAMLVPARYGGLGLGLSDAVPAFEELGAELVPGPWAQTAVLAPVLLGERATAAQRERYCTAIVRGARFCAVHLADTRAGDAAPPELVTADGSAILNGAVPAVHHADDSDYLIVRARPVASQGSVLCIVPRDAAGLEIRGRASLDRTQSRADVALRDVAISRDDVLAEPPRADGLADPEQAALLVALGAMMVGSMSRLVEMSAEYAKVRTQFGQPIGRFQAVKHRIADMKVALEACRSLVFYAAFALDAGAADAAVAAEGAKAYVSRAFLDAAGTNIQNHGAIGYTAEFPAHWYLKRAKAWVHLGGNSAGQLLRVARHLTANAHDYYGVEWPEAADLAPSGKGA